jgi:hydrogenase-4 component F
MSFFSGDIIIGGLFAVPVIGMLVCCLPMAGRAYLRTAAAVAACQCAVVAAVCITRPLTHRIFAFDNNLFLDTLSLYHAGLVSIVFLLSSFYSLTYFSDGIDRGTFTAKRAQRFALIWNGFLTALIGVLCSNNLGLLWICLEATTLVSALLIMTDGQRASIEAMWKYLLLCSVGIAFAFVGTLLLSVAARNASFSPRESLLWTALYERAGILDGRIMCAAFIFILVGFGTKAGLAPMHTWLPDAHSQAPTPVSAVFSGIMLNCALYCIMRYLPLCEAAMGWTGKPHAMLIVFGLLSILVAAVFIPAQKNIKRLLAYHSVEHMGIIALGLGLGGFGTFAALFHTLNHSISKILAFFSAGRLAHHYGTYDMSAMKGGIASNPLWGTAFFTAILALIGVAPFSVFMSELQLVKASIDVGKILPLAVFLFGAIVVFVSALKHAIDVSFGANVLSAPAAREARASKTASIREAAIVAVCGGLLLSFGLLLPRWYVDILTNAANIVEGAGHLWDGAGGMFP